MTPINYEMTPIRLIGVVSILLSGISFSCSDIGIKPRIYPDYDFMTPGRIVRGKNVYLTCTFYENSLTDSITEIYFARNGVILHDDPKNGIRILGLTLMLQNVNGLNTNGGYICSVRLNTQAILKTSHAFFITVDDNENVDSPDYIGLPTISLAIQGNYENNEVSRFDEIFLVCNIESRMFEHNKQNYFEITWYYHDEKIKSTFDGPVATFASILSLGPIQMNRAGNYSCEVFTTLGIVASQPLLLRVKNVYYDPSKWKNYMNSTAYLGEDINPDEIFEFDDVYVTCNITPQMTKILSLSWTHNKMNLPRNITNGIVYEGTKLVFKRIAKSSTGWYSCTVDTEFGLLISKSVKIQVKENTTAESFVFKEFRKQDIQKQCPAAWDLLERPHEPKVRLEIQDKYNEEDILKFDNVYFNCHVTPVTTKVYDIKWMLNGEKLSPNRTIKIINHPPTIVFLNVTELSTGNITCLVVMPGNITMKSNTLNLDVKKTTGRPRYKDTPIILAELLHHPKFIYINQPAVFLHCHIYSKMKMKILNITWFRQGEESTSFRVDNETSPANQSDYYATYYGRTLKIHRIKEKHIGDYRCQVVTRNGTYESAPAPLLFINDRRKLFYTETLVRTHVTAELLDEDEPNYLYKNDIAYFFCNVKPTTLARRRIIWFRDNQLLDETFYDYIAISDRTLRLNRLKKVYVGNYSCQVETAIGTFFSEPKRLKVKDGIKISETPCNTGEVFVDATLAEPSELNDIREGDLVHLRCNVIPHQLLHSTKWYHNGIELLDSFGTSIVYGYRLLHLHNIQVNSTGNFSCEIYSKRGQYRSSDIYLNVKPGRRENPLKIPNMYFLICLTHDGEE